METRPEIGVASKGRRGAGKRPAEPEQLGKVFPTVKAVAILEAMATAKRPLAVSEIGVLLGLPKPTAHRIVRMLENEGFTYECYVDIFDGGPTMTARTDQVTTIRNVQAAALTGTELAKGEKALIASGRLAEFRCCYGARHGADAGVAVDSTTADLLHAAMGETVWSVSR